MTWLRLENRTGKVISLGRLTLALFIAAAVFFGFEGDPTFPRLTLAIGFSYVALAAFLLAVTWSNWWLEQRLKLISHLVDLAFFAALDLSTGLTVSSPFSGIFVFLIFSAAAKWGWREAVATAIVAASVFAAQAAFELAASTMAPGDYVRIIVRAGNLLVLSLMIGWFGATRIGERRDRDRRFPEGTGLDPPVRQALVHMAGCVGAKRLALVWSEPEEPWINIASLEADGEVRREKSPPGDYPWLLAPGCETRTFLFDIANRHLLFAEDGSLEALSKIEAVNPDLAAKLGIEEGLVAPIHSHSFDGWFIAGGIDGLCRDDLPPARRAAIDIGHGFDRAAALRLGRESAETRTRLGVARDLHDSVSQIMAGIALKLRAARTKTADERDRDRELEAIERELASYQQDVNRLIEDLKSPFADPLRVDLQVGLSGLALWLERHWRIEVELAAERLTAVSRGLEAEISHLVRESAANAVRHGGATRIRLAAAREGDELVLSVVDNGTGFARHGSFSDADLADQRIGPGSIRERVHALGGSVALVSSADGAQVTMRMPIQTVES
jgi:signal transduction histidine kinase